MYNSQLYEAMKDIARIKRQEYGVTHQNIGLQKVREIYKEEGVKITTREGGFGNLRAAYFSDQLGNEVLLNGKLPADQRLFSLLHEFKHHLVDQQELSGISFCRKYGEQPATEIAAEVFAAEFIWPETDFISMVRDFGLTSSNTSPSLIVAFKRSSQMPVSYKFINKRLKRFGIITEKTIQGVHFLKLEEETYGQPFWKKRR